MITPGNVFRHELIGLKVEVAESPHKDFKGLKGRVIDETKNTLKIELKDGKEIIIPKNVAIFHFKLPNGQIVEIDGRIIVGRPEERIKKKFKKI
ncbi:MAG TPA: ribonuclease P protein component 1 [Methanothermobacter sp.]|jgi:ribonuclease P protein subunit POP4|uniref:Ribonuclease P protein component 1 n=1 Tax=Methanothermobacter tenebrarum TaxID=680118 RepID=A0ABM7YEC7_9EURY|nr:ribonuclease P protein component 1 [Methanothermobacter tenebrarum]MDD3454632.1 ribonuclease P protein component 1 [Methanobacteriales archaeon]MDI6881475.1 ribonuclease P protein component 1 [Methanothermobacter sp.]MDX9692926.1 ribonuclease P protein component 1 [Methanothermobacter sp.]BDH79751.1 ribonuclease P [Methanothermobacter tenebrarum]HHW16608.1 ribonuclease P protein component 1 [Methanothermobacter sp.]